MPSPVILTATDLAERWQITPAELARRLPRLGLPGVNVGSDRRPDWRFRLAAIEDWESQNEATIGQPSPTDAHPIPAGRPPTVATDFFRGDRRRNKS